MQRKSLNMQVAEALREGIASGFWEGYLPAERELCQRLQVSRPVLRSALKTIEQEGLVALEGGRRRAILALQRGPNTARAQAVALVSKLPLHSMSQNRVFLVHSMQRSIQEHHLRMEIISHPGFGTNRPTAALHHLQEQGEFRAFVLMWSSHEVQKWFSQRSLPTLVLGSSFPDLSLASIDSDYCAIGRHAAGIFWGKGHRRAALIVPESRHAGDIETEESFLEGWKHADSTPPCRILRHGSSSDELVTKIEALMASPNAPTAFLVIKAFATATLVSTLLSRGIRIPQDVSIISRDSDPLLEWINPAIAHYVFPLRRMASRISRLVIEMTSSSPLPPRPTRIMPEFCLAHSVASRSSG